MAPPAAVKSRALTYAKKVLLSLAAALLTLAVCEGVLWIVGYEYSPLAIEAEQTVSDWRMYHAFGDDCFRYDPKLFWRPKPYRSVFNAQGFRGRALEKEKLPGEYRIFAVGDSNTLGWDPNDTDKRKNGANWPEFLERRLDPLGTLDRRFVVINAGVYGYSSLQGLWWFEETLAYQPDMVLISFGSNDALRVPVADAQFADGLFRSPLLKTRLGQLFLSARDRVAAGREYADEDLVPRVSVEEYRENLGRIIELCRERDIRCVLLTRPFTGESEAEIWWKNFAPQYVEATIELGAEEDITVVDVYDHFQDREDCFADESHFTEQGHELAADLIYERLEPLLP